MVIFMKLIKKIDPYLLFGCMVLITMGLACLISASHNHFILAYKQLYRLGLGFGVMLIAAAIEPKTWYQITPWFYTATLILLIIVSILGYTGNGAQRWLNLGFIRFEPSELMKLALPMMLSWWLHQQKLPIKSKDAFYCVIYILMPALLILKQPDLGTAILLSLAGLSVIFLAGLSRKLIISAITAIIILAPLGWHHLHDYQKQRILTFINPEKDPLGNGYHIIQSKIAIGSGGLTGKGWMQSTQAHLNFLPEHTTDFIFALYAEEFGFIGVLLLIATSLFITFRILYISWNAHNSFRRLLSASISNIFFIAVCVNIGMNCGILPVVGVPLTLVSFGGSSLITIMLSFGIVMSINAQKELMLR